jgi:2-oxoglutarate ferredoxin oxidoreductase subunit alpha
MFEPFPSEYVAKVLKNSHLIIDVESNMTGQAAKVIRMNTGVNIENFILKYNGRHITLDEVLRSTKNIMEKKTALEVLQEGS